MAGQGEGLTHRQEQALAALLVQPSIDRAAEACKVNERTLRRWLREQAFLTAYRDARRQEVEAAVSLLQRIAAKAVATVHRNLDCNKPAVEVKAAVAIIDRALRGVELLELVERVEELERRDQARKNGGEVP
jgi:hypothetical protein